MEEDRTLPCLINLEVILGMTFVTVNGINIVIKELAGGTMSKKTVISLCLFRNITSWTLAAILALTSCMAPPVSSPMSPAQKPITNPAPADGFHTKSVTATEPAPPHLEQVSSTPANPAFELKMQTGQTVANTIRMPEQGTFKLSVEVGPSNQILDSDGTDGLAKIQLTAAAAYDLYLHPEQTSAPNICQGTGSAASIADQMDQLVLNKANALVAAGESQCTYLPPTNQRQNANCNSNSTGFQCSGALNKTIQTAQCPEIAIYAGAVNINNDLTVSKLFIATSNNLTVNQSAKGVLATRGNLNTSVNGSRQLEGVFVGGSSNNMNVSDTATAKGLFSLANGASLNLNGSATLDGTFCASGNVNANRNGSSKTIYHPNVLDLWVTDVPNIGGLICDARANFYTQTIPQSCSANNAPATLGVSDPLYLLNQTVNPVTDGSWFKMAGRPLPVPADWFSADGQNYVLTLDNHGMTSLTAQFFSQNTASAFPQTVKVIPKLDCVQQNRLGTHTAYFSFNNQMSGAVSIPIGSLNRFQPEPENAGQTVHFSVGQSSVYPNSPIAVSFVGDQLNWNLGARTVSVQANDQSQRCPQDGGVQIPSDVSVRKTLLEPTSLSFSNGEETKHITINISDSVDLKRRLLLTTISGGMGSPVNELEVRINGQKLAPGFPTQVIISASYPEASFEVSGLFKAGTNTLDVIARSNTSSQATIRVDGFMLPIDIPGAFHSAISDDEAARNAPIQKGIVGIKFLEGMHVRLNENGPIEQRLVEDSGISLSMLNSLLKSKFTSIVSTLPGTQEQKDSEEQQLQTMLHQEVPNGGLFYLLSFDGNQDVWQVVDKLKMLPYFEEVYPIFIPQSSASYSRFEPEEVKGSEWDKTFHPDFGPLSRVPNTYWLMVTHILGAPVPIENKLLPLVPLPYPMLDLENNKKPSDVIKPDSNNPGAWDITRGSSSITTAVIDRGAKPDHPDLSGVTKVNNTFSDSNYHDYFHGTATAGIVGANHDTNGYGVAGVAYEGKTLAIQAYSDAKSRCLGTGRGDCEPTVDAIEYAINHDSKVVILEAWGGDDNPKTLEQLYPDVRYDILRNSALNDVVFVIPAGNRPCQKYDINANIEPPKEPIDPSKLAPCIEKFKKGVDIRTSTVTFSLYSIFDSYLLDFPTQVLPDHLAQFGVGHKVGEFVAEVPTYDTGSIIIGGLDIEGKRKAVNWKNQTLPPMNHGKSITDENDNLLGRVVI